MSKEKRIPKAEYLPFFGISLKLVECNFRHRLVFGGSVKQAHAVRERADLPVTDEEWSEKFDKITSGQEGAREQLRAGWKDWLAARIPVAVALWGRGRQTGRLFEELIVQATCHSWRTRQSEPCC